MFFAACFPHASPPSESPQTGCSTRKQPQRLSGGISCKMIGGGWYRKNPAVGSSDSPESSWHVISEPAIGFFRVHSSPHPPGMELPNRGPVWAGTAVPSSYQSKVSQRRTNLCKSEVELLLRVKPRDVKTCQQDQISHSRDPVLHRFRTALETYQCTRAAFAGPKLGN